MRGPINPVSYLIVVLVRKPQKETQKFISINLHRLKPYSVIKTLIDTIYIRKQISNNEEQLILFTRDNLFVCLH